MEAAGRINPSFTSTIFFFFLRQPQSSQSQAHEIALNNANPVKMKLYQVPLLLRNGVFGKIKKMENFGIIERGDSPYCSPVVVVCKKTGASGCAATSRVNVVTQVKAEPIHNQFNIFINPSTYNVLSKLFPGEELFPDPAPSRVKGYHTFRHP